MAYLQLESNSPEFSFAISKNPNSEMLIKQIRYGNTFGWFTGENKYNLFFKDSWNEVSFKEDADEEYEYLNVSRYNSSLFVCSALNEFFKSTINKLDKHDKEGYIHSVSVGMLHIKNVETFQKFIDHFNGVVDISLTELVGKEYSINISTTNKTLQYILCFTLILCFYNAIINDENIFIDDVLLEKYIRILNIIDAPYFIRYIFKVKFITGNRQFEKVKNELQQSSLYNINLVYGDTHYQRIQHIKNIVLNENNSVVDIGCGEGRYVTAYSGLLKDKKYFAYDIDENQLEKVKRKIEYKKLENVELFDNIFNLFHAVQTSNLKFTAIMTEVIEHMTIKEAVQTINSILSIENIKSIVITTPNKDFNKYYFEDVDQKRREDHVFEMTKAEFVNFSTVYFGQYKIEVQDIGDVVDNVTPTMCLFIKK